MILLSKKIYLLNIRYTYKCLNFLKNYKYISVPIIKKIQSFKRLIILRSPKHFNIGKLQLFQNNSSLTIQYPVNYKLNAMKLNYRFRDFLNYIPVAPTTYLNHIEVQYTLSIKFTFL